MFAGGPNVSLNTKENCWMEECLPRSKVGQWAAPSGTAMLGQPVTKPEQAPKLHPLTKISLISKGSHEPRIRY